VALRAFLGRDFEIKKMPMKGLGTKMGAKISPLILMFLTPSF
jgi:hypothetical protein